MNNTIIPRTIRLLNSGTKSILTCTEVKDDVFVINNKIFTM